MGREIGINRALDNLLTVILSQRPVGPKMCRVCEMMLFPDEFQPRRRVCKICDAMRVKRIQKKRSTTLPIRRSKSGKRTADLRRRYRLRGDTVYVRLRS